MVRGERRRRTSRARTVAKVVAAVLVALGLVTGASVAVLYHHLNGNLDVQPLGPQLGSNRPEQPDVGGPHEPLNILVMGSDSRACDGCHIDGESGGGSDTTMLFHLAADRRSAYAVSIPRDSLVDRPDCLTEDGDTIPGETGAMWNAAFSVGGPACTIHQLEEVTGIRVTNYVVVDFNGFKGMVDAVGGVEVCVPEDLDSDEAHLHIPQGVHRLRGQEALDYIRIRTGVGDGTDLGRIKRQQAFVASLAQEVIDKERSARFDQLLGFLDAATKSLTTDVPNIRDLAEIGLQFKDLGEDRIRFITVPNQFSTEHPGRVEWLPQAQTLWDRLRLDQPLGSLRDGSIGLGEVGSSPAATTPGSPTSSPGPTSPVGADPSDLEAAGLCT
jgi:LCP family protein required for cell wall assembly